MNLFQQQSRESKKDSTFLNSIVKKDKTKTSCSPVLNDEQRPFYGVIKYMYIRVCIYSDAIVFYYQQITREQILICVSLQSLQKRNTKY